MPRLAIAQKITLFNIGGSLLGLVLTISLVFYALTSEMDRLALERQEMNIRLLQDMLQATGAVTVNADGKLMAGDHVIGSTHELVDRAAAVTGSIFTIFASDRRVSTTIRTADGKRSLNTRLEKGPVWDSLYRDGKAWLGLTEVMGEDYFVNYVPLRDQNGKPVGAIVSALKKSTYISSVGQVVTHVIIAALFSGAIVSALLFWLLRGQLRGLGELGRTISRLARHELDVTIPETGRKDDIGEIARALEIFRANALERERLEASQREEVARRATRQQRIEALTSRFDASVREAMDVIGGSVTDLNDVSVRMNETADLTSQESASASSVTQQAASNIESVSAATRQLTDSIQDISHQITHAARISRDAVNESDCARMNVQGLAEAASRIGEVVSLINDIAAQTNLLALNATIEAARAGEAGKGFAVVASEVKSLANQTARATEEISAQVSGIQDATDQSVAAIQSIAATIGEISNLSTRLASAVEQQTAATMEIARNVDEASQGTIAVNDSISQVACMARETGQTARNVSTAAATLQTRSASLRAEVDGFLSDVAAA